MLNDNFNNINLNNNNTSTSNENTSIVSSITMDSSILSNSSESIDITSAVGANNVLKTYEEQSKQWSKRKKKKIINELQFDIMNDEFICCSKNCIANFNVLQIQNIRYNYLQENEERKRIMVQQALNQRKNNSNKKFILETFEVCVNCYIYCTGISKHSVYNPLYLKNKYGPKRNNFYRIIHSNNENEENYENENEEDYEDDFEENKFNRNMNRHYLRLEEEKIRKNTYIMEYFSNLIAFNDVMPDSGYTCLPHASKFDVYVNYNMQMEQKEKRAMCSWPYFLRTWNSKYSNVKLRKHSTFTHCDFCEEMKEILITTLDSKIRTKTKNNYREHLQYVKKERECYYEKRLKAKTNPNEYMSIIIDGSDMASYGLPYFYRQTKETVVGYKMLMKLIGVIVHGIGVFVFLVHKNWAADPNLTIEVLHRVFSFLAPFKPKKLFIQVFLI